MFLFIGGKSASHRRSAAKAHSMRVAEADEILRTLMTGEWIAERVPMEDQAAEARACAENAQVVLDALKAMKRPNDFVLMASASLLDAARTIDAVVTAGRGVWLRGWLYQAAARIGQTSAHLEMARMVFDDGASGRGGRPAGGESDAAISKQWLQLGTTGREEHERAAVIATRLKVPVRTVRDRVKKLDLRSKGGKQRG